MDQRTRFLQGNNAQINITFFAFAVLSQKSFTNRLQRANGTLRWSCADASRHIDSFKTFTKSLLQDDALWAQLASLAAAARNLQVAQVAYAAIDEVEKVEFLHEVR